MGVTSVLATMHREAAVLPHLVKPRITPGAGIAAEMPPLDIRCLPFAPPSMPYHLSPPLHDVPTWYLICPYLRLCRVVEGFPPRLQLARLAQEAPGDWGTHHTA